MLYAAKSAVFVNFNELNFPPAQLARALFVYELANRQLHREAKRGGVNNVNRVRVRI